MVNATTDQILMGNTCELPWMGSRKYFSRHKSLLRDVSGAIDSLPTCEWRSDIYHLRINIMRVCSARRVTQIFMFVVRFLPRTLGLEPSIGYDKIATSTFPHISSISRNTLNDCRSLETEIIVKQTSLSSFLIKRAAFEFFLVYVKV